MTQSFVTFHIGKSDFFYTLLNVLSNVNRQSLFAFLYFFIYKLCFLCNNLFIFIMNNLELDEADHTWRKVSESAPKNSSHETSRETCPRTKKKKIVMAAVVTVLGLAIVGCLMAFLVSAGPMPQAQQNDVESLKLVFGVFRHGARTPVTTYNSDPHRHYAWPDGFGALTATGKLQMYTLGQRLRQRYSGFLPQEFWDSDVYVRSSDMARTLMSASLVMAGLYPPAQTQQWHPDLSWQPVPVHAVPRDQDNTLAAKKKCPAYDELYLLIRHSEELRSFNKQHEDLFEHLTKHGNQTIKDVTPLELLYSTFKIQHENGLTLPLWAQEVYPHRMELPAAFGLTLFTFNNDLKRLKSGPLLKEMITNMDLKSAGKLYPNRKIFMYSAHDVTIVSLWRTLGFTEYLIPDYGSCLILELHSLPNTTDVEIKVVYYPSSSGEPRPLQVPGCDSPCTLRQFKEILHDVIPDNWEQECYSMASRRFNKTTTLPTTTVPTTTLPTTQTP